MSQGADPGRLPRAGHQRLRQAPGKVKEDKDQWELSTSPAVLAVIGDLKEEREAADGEIPLLEYAPDSEHAQAMREQAKELAV